MGKPGRRAPGASQRADPGLRVPGSLKIQDPVLAGTRKPDACRQVPGHVVPGDFGTGSWRRVRCSVMTEHFDSCLLIPGVQG